MAAANTDPDVDQTGDRARLSWFTTVRWTTVLAGAGALVAGRNALGVAVPVGWAGVGLAACAASNLWIDWQSRRNVPLALRTAPVLMCADVALLSWLLLQAGGVLNPASVFYLVEIVVAALVFGRQWTWAIAALAVVGYAALFLAPTDDLRSAQVMHPEIDLHMRGMWLAFALTAVVIAALVTRLAVLVERRDRAVAELRERHDRVTRAASLATLAAGAAHELSTPLATIAVAARELERMVQQQPNAVRDARLIRAETERCRSILDAMATQHGDPAGEIPTPSTVHAVIDLALERVDQKLRSRIYKARLVDMPVVWPVRVVARAVTNLIDNALQAGATNPSVLLKSEASTADRIAIAITDNGAGMSPSQLARAGEPFFTTKPPGKGTGLGLFVAKSTVEQLGGSLAMTSTIGVGTTVVVDLPRDCVRPRSKT